MSMNLHEQTYQQKQKMKQNFLLRVFFKAYFPSQIFHHLNKTTDHLLLKILSSPNYLNKLNSYLITDPKIANQLLIKKIKSGIHNLASCKGSFNIQHIQTSLTFCDKNAIQNIPYFLK